MAYTPEDVGSKPTTGIKHPLRFNERRGHMLRDHKHSKP